jgi:2-desacetyl-2-hydroxyethyl bacteriochlorophyllide A dehydrogenase
MRAVIYDDVGSIRVGDYPDPSVQEPTDVVVKVTTGAICGSDLHLLHGRIPGIRPGSVLGHEFVGEVASVGPEVKRFKTGDRVVGSFLIVCGKCWFCRRGQFNFCQDQMTLGYGMFVGDLDGCQAEYVRIPWADNNLHLIDPALSDEQAIFAGDILSTGAFVAAEAGIQEGDIVAVMGAGPVGLFSLMAALTYKPSKVYVIDMAPDRLKLAESIGGVPVDANKVNPVVEIQRQTEDRGADVVLECIGSTKAFDTAINVVRTGGVVSVIGVYTELSYDFPIGEVWRRGVKINMAGICNVHANWSRVLEQVKDGAIDPTVIITHTLPLEDAVKGYQMFEAREALKVLLKP